MYACFYAYIHRPLYINQKIDLICSYNRQNTMRHNVRMMFNFLIPLIGILATIFAVSSTVPQIIKGIKTRKMDDVSVWLIMTLIIGLSLWVVYGISKSDVVIAGGNSVGVSLNVILLLLKVKYSR